MLSLVECKKVLSAIFSQSEGSARKVELAAKLNHKQIFRAHNASQTKYGVQQNKFGEVGPGSILLNNQQYC